MLKKTKKHKTKLTTFLDKGVTLHNIPAHIIYTCMYVTQQMWHGQSEWFKNQYVTTCFTT